MVTRAIKDELIASATQYGRLIVCHSAYPGSGRDDRLSHISAMDCSFRHSVSGFLRNSQNLPDQPALILGPQTYTYAQLRQLAGSWANLLLDVGGKGGRKLE